MQKEPQAAGPTPGSLLSSGAGADPGYENVRTPFTRSARGSARPKSFLAVAFVRFRHLSYDRDTSVAGTLQRRQLWVNLASYRTFTATVNAASPAGLSRPSAAANGGSILWNDFHRAASGPAGGYAPHSAVRLVEAGIGEQVLSATQEVRKINPQLDLMTGKTNPQMKPWYLAGARVMEAELRKER